MDAAIENITPKRISSLKQVFFCGGYGEPLMYSRYLETVEKFRRINPNLYILTHTNGSVRHKEFWSELAKLIPDGLGRVVFGIDGLEDTNHLHRQKTDFNKIMANAGAFIESGGNAQWNFLVFEHNVHQVESARELARKTGFKTFKIRKTGRFFDQRDFKRMEKWDVRNESGQIKHQLEMPKDKKFRNKSLDHVERLVEKYGSFKAYLDQTIISCNALLDKKIFVTVEGCVLPCGFLNENIYDARFFDDSIDPRAPEFRTENNFMQIFDRVGKDRINVTKRSLKEILNESFYSEIIESWRKESVEKGKFWERALTCGAEFNKCWDQ